MKCLEHSEIKPNHDSGSAPVPPFGVFRVRSSPFPLWARTYFSSMGQDLFLIYDAEITYYSIAALRTICVEYCLRALL